MNNHDVIQRMCEVACTPKQIAHVVGVSKWDVTKYITKNNLSTAGLPNPSQYPDSYFIDRLKKNYTVSEIAEEIGASTAAVYRQLSIRGISKYTYTFLDEEY